MLYLLYKVWRHQKIGFIVKNVILGQRHLSSKYKKNNSARVYKSNINKLLEPETKQRTIQEDGLGKLILSFQILLLGI